MSYVLLVLEEGEGVGICATLTHTHKYQELLINVSCLQLVGVTSFGFFLIKKTGGALAFTFFFSLPFRRLFEDGVFAITPLGRVTRHDLTGCCCCWYCCYLPFVSRLRNADHRNSWGVCSVLLLSFRVSIGAGGGVSLTSLHEHFACSVV